MYRPKSGSTLLYSRKKVRYRRDGYCWKKRKDGKTTREDHMKLKVQGIEVSKYFIKSSLIKVSIIINYLNLNRRKTMIIYYFIFSAFTVVMFILQSYQRFIDDATGFYR